ncbi:unnamed protein product [Closterium sp. NIES-65]|nr:unnamed protein product [Closterium sp. NIES-65]
MDGQGRPKLDREDSSKQLQEPGQLSDATSSSELAGAVFDAKSARRGRVDVSRHNLPLSSIVNQAAVKEALLAAAVDPGLGGVALVGGHGTGKTVMARALPLLLPPIAVVEGSWANADPLMPEEWEEGLRESIRERGCDEHHPPITLCNPPFVQVHLGVMEGGLLGSVDVDGRGLTSAVPPCTPSHPSNPCPLVPSLAQVPLGVTEDRLLGSVDVEASIQAGRNIFLPGLLAPSFVALTHRYATHRYATHRYATHRYATHRYATHRYATHRYATHRYATHRYATHRYATHRYATHRYATHRYATHRYATHRYATHRYATHRYATHRYATPVAASLVAASPSVWHAVRIPLHPFHTTAGLSERVAPRTPRVVSYHSHAAHHASSTSIPSHGVPPWHGTARHTLKMPTCWTSRWANAPTPPFPPTATSIPYPPQSSRFSPLSPPPPMTHAGCSRGALHRPRQPAGPCTHALPCPAHSPPPHPTASHPPPVLPSHRIDHAIAGCSTAMPPICWMMDAVPPTPRTFNPTAPHRTPPHPTAFHRIPFPPYAPRVPPWSALYGRRQPAGRHAGGAVLPSP